MMMGDAGYGFLLTLACAILLKFGNFGKKHEAKSENVFVLQDIDHYMGLLFGSFSEMS